MRQPPINRIAPDAIKAWKISAAIAEGVLWLITIALFVLAFIFEFSYWYGLVAIFISGVSTFFTVFLLPKLRWRRWRYEVFEQEIYIQHGILIVSRTLVPMIRVQHVDTKQGPILKKYKLASVEISTAATTHEIPALLEEDASELRDKISALARVDEDDV
ncbi:PH domain-containing protein [Lentibacillus sp.]|uniref:PH domain-containing protein n=1 Tax=Lentibacillus sp. TaxID=1925746 RepID=UPI002B4AF5AF|nr:PH domain-containing protein [Lentibacillus sp.]HLS07801.1 PH domain-containing protein [Lentibacillus sp.]